MRPENKSWIPPKLTTREEKEVSLRSDYYAYLKKCSTGEIDRIHSSNHFQLFNIEGVK